MSSLALNSFGYDNTYLYCWNKKNFKIQNFEKKREGKLIYQTRQETMKATFWFNSTLTREVSAIRQNFRVISCKVHEKQQTLYNYCTFQLTLMLPMYLLNVIRNHSIIDNIRASESGDYGNFMLTSLLRPYTTPN